MLSFTDYKYSLIFFALTVLFGFIGGGVTLKYRKTWLAVCCGLGMLTSLVFAIFFTTISNQKVGINDKQATDSEEDTPQEEETYTIRIPKDKEIKLKIVIE